MLRITMEYEEEKQVRGIKVLHTKTYYKDVVLRENSDILEIGKKRLLE